MLSSGLVRIVLRIGRLHILRICLCIWTWFVPCFIVSFTIWTLSVYVEYSGHRHTDLHHHLLRRTREIEWAQTASTLISSPFWQYGGSVRRTNSHVSDISGVDRGLFTCPRPPSARQPSTNIQSGNVTTTDAIYDGSTSSGYWRQFLLSTRQ